MAGRRGGQVEGSRVAAQGVPELIVRARQVEENLVRLLLILNSDGS